MNNFIRQARGQALVEFAIILTIVFFFIVGIFDLGRAFHAAIVIENASREGARYGTKYPYADDMDSMKAAVIQEANNSGIVLNTSDVYAHCYDLDSNDFCDSGTRVLVTVTYEFKPLLELFLPTNLQLVRSTQMMVP